MAMNQITGGPFQDASGNPLINGYLVFQLQHDAVIVGTGVITGGISVQVPLDSNGYIRGTTTGAPVNIWPNDQMAPSGLTYLVYAYDQYNRTAWSNPQVQPVLSSPSPYNVNNAWTPGP
jgi:hypothetical protein